MKAHRTIPNVRVGPLSIPVVVNDDLDGLYGRYVEMPETRIEVAKGTHDTVYLTILHESLHAIDAMYALNLGERRVRVLENVLAAFIKDNPVLVSELTKTKTKRRADRS